MRLMRNVILCYVFNSDSCFYLMKFLSRENGVLHIQLEEGV